MTLPRFRNTRNLSSALALSAVLLFVFYLRFSFLNSRVAPTGADAGGYLDQAHRLLGNDVTGFGLHYPPLYFIYLNGLLLFLPELFALKVSAALLSSVIGLPFYFLVRKVSRPILSVVLTFLFVMAEAFSEMISWGGQPNLLGIALLLTFLVLFFDTLHTETPMRVVASGLVLSLIVGTHPLTLAVTVLFILSFLGILWLREKKALVPQLRASMKVTALAIVLSVPYLPSYLEMLQQIASNQPVGPDQFTLFMEGVAFIFRESPLVWLFMTAVGLVSLLKWKDRMVQNFVVGMFLSIILLSFLLGVHAGRSLYYLTIPIVLAFSFFFSLLVENLRIAKRTQARLGVALAVLFLVLLGVLVGSIDRQEKALEFFDFIGEDELEMLDWIKVNTPSNAVVAVAGDGLGWWLQGYGERKAITTGDPKNHLFLQEKQEVEDANRLFSGNYVIESQNVRVSDSFPHGSLNPQLYVKTGTRFEPLLSFNDAFIEIAFSPDHNRSTVWRESLIYAPEKAVNIKQTEQGIAAKYSFNFTHVRVLRGVTVRSDATDVQIQYHLTFIDSFPRYVDIYIWSSTEVQGFDLRMKQVQVTHVLPDGRVEKSTLNYQTTGTVLAIDSWKNDPRFGLPAVRLRINGTREVVVDFFVRMGTSTEESSTPILYEPAHILRIYGVNYVVISKEQWREFDVVESNTEIYEKVFENENTAAYKVAGATA